MFTAISHIIDRCANKQYSNYLLKKVSGNHEIKKDTFYIVHNVRSPSGCWFCAYRNLCFTYLTFPCGWSLLLWYYVTWLSILELEAFNYHNQTVCGTDYMTYLTNIITLNLKFKLGYFSQYFVYYSDNFASYRKFKKIYFKITVKNR